MFIHFLATQVPALFSPPLSVTPFALSSAHPSLVCNALAISSVPGQGGSHDLISVTSVITCRRDVFEQASITSAITCLFLPRVSRYTSFLLTVCSITGPAGSAQ